ncbi:MAG: PAS domain S-box protein [Desulfobacteraceae bacterium]|nr:PAS domain S-box protein [Desulfobacteraceae bacterium]
MNFDLTGLKIAIIGGSDPVCEILDILTGPGLRDLDIKVLILADILKNTRGVIHAKSLGIPTTTDYSDVCNLKDLDLILKLKNDEILACILEKINTERVSIIDLDSYRAMSFISFLKTEEEKIRIRKKICDKGICREDIASLFDKFSNRMIEISDKETAFLNTEREDLLEMEKELSQIIQGSMIPTFIINNEHILTHWNRACEELTGYDAYELVGTDRQWVPFRSAKRPTMADVVVGQMSQKDVGKYYGTSWRKSKIVKEAYEAEEFFPHLGKNGKWIFFTAAPIKSPDGKIIGAIETLRDQTEDKKAQQEIDLQDQELFKLHEKYKKSEEKYRSLFNNNPNPIFIIDYQSLEILDINHRVENDYGFSKLELLGRPFLEVGDSDDETIYEGLKGLQTGEAILFTKKRHYKNPKEAFFVNMKVVNARYSHRDVLIASTTDITESVEKETQLIQAGKLATLGTMAAGMAHEINQPLNVIQICADLILKMVRKGVAIPDDELVVMAKDIIDNVARASGVIKHVRDFARQSDRDLKKMNLNDPINDVFKVLGHQLTVHAVIVVLELDPDLPEIRAEHNRLEQVFINLVTNAIDAMDEKAEKTEGSVEKKLCIKTFVKANEVIASVSDTGMGMSEAVKSKIFEPFFTTKETGKGTGLGTSISFGIIKDYGGSIDIKSVEGEGTNFTIKFPRIE